LGDARNLVIRWLSGVKLRLLDLRYRIENDTVMGNAVIPR